jgi:hypothetical protein
MSVPHAAPGPDFLAAGPGLESAEFETGGPAPEGSRMVGGMDERGSPEDRPVSGNGSTRDRIGRGSHSESESEASGRAPNEPADLTYTEDSPEVERAMESVGRDAVISWALQYVAEIPGAIASADDAKYGLDQTFDVACVLVKGYAMDRTDSLRVMEVYNTRCEPFWTQGELIHKIEDADKEPDDKPRGYLLRRRLAHELTVRARREEEDDHRLKPPPAFPKPEDAAVTDSAGKAPERAEEATPVEEDARPKIEITTRRNIVVVASIAALVVDPGLYCRGERLVIVVEEADDAIQLTPKTVLRGTAGSPRIIPLSDSNVGCFLAKNASFFKWKRDKEGEW